MIMNILANIMLLSVVLALAILISIFILEPLILLIIKRKDTLHFGVVKELNVSKSEWIYIIPAIGFAKTGNYLELSIDWLGYNIYIAYKFKDYDNEL